MEKIKVCTKCQESKSFDLFGLNRHATDGRQSWCKSCDAEHKRTVRWNRPAEALHQYKKQLRRNERVRVFAQDKNITKECRSCNQILPATCEHFYRANGKLGFGAYCKPCSNVKRQERRKKRRAQ